MQNKTQNLLSKKQFIIGLIAILLVGIIGVGIFAFVKESNNDQQAAISDNESVKESSNDPVIGDVEAGVIDEDEDDPDSDLSLSELNALLAGGSSAKDKHAALDIFILNNGYEPAICHNELSDGLFSTTSSEEALEYLNNLQSLPLALRPYVEDLKGLVNNSINIDQEELAQIRLNHQVVDHLSERDEETGTLIESSRTCKYDIAGLEI